MNTSHFTILGAVLTLLSSPIFAQNPPAPDRSGSRVIEEIVVTATKREQSVNDIPVAVSAYEGAQLERAGVRDLGELKDVSPAIYFGSTESSASGNLTMRGIGTLGTDPGLESSVGIFIDGVYRNRAGVGIDELGEIERIEVLRGPQGSLFGRNTSAGLVHVLTRRPSFEEREGFIGLTIGNYKLKRLATAISGPLVDGKLAGRIDAVVTRRDGYIDDINSNDTYANRDRYMVRTQFEFDPSDDLSARVILDFSDRDELCCGSPSSQQAIGPQNVSDLTLANPNDRGLDDDADPYDGKVAFTSGRPLEDDARQWGISAEVSKDFAMATGVSVTAYREWEAAISGDADYSGADLLYYPANLPQRRTFDTFSQEFRLQGGWESGSWLVGLYFSDETLGGAYTARYGNDMNSYAVRFFRSAMDPDGFGTFNFLTQGNNFLPGDGVHDTGDQDGQSLAIFSQEDFDLNSNLVLTIGARYTIDDKDRELVTRNEFSPNGNPCLGAATNPNAPPEAVQLICGISALTQPLLTPGTYNASRDDKELSGTIKLAYTLPDETLLYASLARGFKGGGFNASRLSLDPRPGLTSGSNLEFAGETADTVELGIKTFLLNRTMSLNATVFHSKFKDFQLGQFDGVTLKTISVDQVDSQGVEMESTWLATDELTVNLGVVYSDNRYPDDSNIDQVAPTSTGNQRAGSRLSRYWSATAGITWIAPLTDTIVGSFHLDGRYNSDSFSNSQLAPVFREPELMVLNARIGIGNTSQVWGLELWARNLADEGYSPIRYDPPPIQGIAGAGRIGDFIGEPRTYGLTLRRNL